MTVVSDVANEERLKIGRASGRLLGTGVPSQLLRSTCGEGKIAIALEQRRGALFYHLCTHLNWIDLYPINPHSLASFRKTFFSSRAKDDPVDSQLLEELLRTHPERVRPYQPEPTTERKLEQYCRHRRLAPDTVVERNRNDEQAIAVDCAEESVFETKGF